MYKTMGGDYKNILICYICAEGPQVHMHCIDPQNIKFNG